MSKLQLADGVVNGSQRSGSCWRQSLKSLTKAREHLLELEFPFESDRVKFSVSGLRASMRCNSLVIGLYSNLTEFIQNIMDLRRVSSVDLISDLAGLSMLIRRHYQ